jgi:IS1 family transposase
MVGDSRNLLQTWLDTASTSGCLHVFYFSLAQKTLKNSLNACKRFKKNFSNTWHAFQHFFSKKHNSLGKTAVKDK